MSLEYEFSISKKSQEELLGSKGKVYWLFGLSGSGKSTIANGVQKKLNDKKSYSILLDGDTVRAGLCKDLGFSKEDRTENLRRVAELAKVQAHNGIPTLCSFITPLKEHRKLIQEILGDDLNLVFIDTSLEECIERDPKGLYKKAKQGLIKGFTGIDSPFEEATSDEVTMILSTSENSIEELVDKLLRSI
jgi:adenylyl-sulfate kinase